MSNPLCSPCQDGDHADCEAPLTVAQQDAGACCCNLDDLPLIDDREATDG